MSQAPAAAPGLAQVLGGQSEELQQVPVFCSVCERSRSAPPPAEVE